MDCLELDALGGDQRVDECELVIDLVVGVGVEHRTDATSGRVWSVQDSTPFRSITCRKKRALAFGVRFCVS